MACPPRFGTLFGIRVEYEWTPGTPTTRNPLPLIPDPVIAALSSDFLTIYLNPDHYHANPPEVEHTDEQTP